MIDLIRRGTEERKKSSCTFITYKSENDNTFEKQRFHIFQPLGFNNATENGAHKKTSIQTKATRRTKSDEQNSCISLKPENKQKGPLESGQRGHGGMLYGKFGYTQ